MATEVVSIRGDVFDVYIGRPSRWGNPFLMGADGTREEVIAKYEVWIQEPEQAALRARLPDLKGKRLGCYCAPAPCHGDVLVRLADATSEEG